MRFVEAVSWKAHIRCSWVRVRFALNSKTYLIRPPLKEPYNYGKLVEASG